MGGSSQPILPICATVGGSAEMYRDSKFGGAKGGVDGEGESVCVYSMYNWLLEPVSQILRRALPLER